MKKSETQSGQQTMEDNGGSGQGWHTITPLLGMLIRAMKKD